MLDFCDEAFDKIEFSKLFPNHNIHLIKSDKVFKILKNLIKSYKVLQKSLKNL